MRKLKHPNIVRMHDVQYKEEKGKIYVVLEYCAGGALQEVLEQHGGKLPLERAQQ